MEKKQCPCCGCLTLDELGAWEICPVCFWEDESGIYRNGSPDPQLASVPNGDLSIVKARRILRRCGACQESMAGKTRKPTPEEVTVMYTNLMNDPDGWLHDLAYDLCIDAFFLVLIASRNSRQANIYTVRDGSVVTYTDWFGGADSIHDRYMKQFSEQGKQPGIHLWRFEYGTPVIQRFYPESEYNSVLYDGYSSYVMFWIEYGLTPPGEEGRAKLEAVMDDAERIRKSLVYACYIGDTEQIIARAKKASPAQLNKAIPYMNTPLGFCAQHGDLEGFRAVMAAGADLGKSVASMSPLGWAMHCSPDIALYIRKNYRAQFDAELKKQGVRLFSQTNDPRLFAVADESGLDLAPLAFDFAKSGNAAGINYLLKKGTDLNVTDSCGCTPVFYAERGGEKTRAVRELLAKA